MTIRAKTYAQVYGRRIQAGALSIMLSLIALLSLLSSLNWTTGVIRAESEQTLKKAALAVGMKQKESSPFPQGQTVDPFDPMVIDGHFMPAVLPPAQTSPDPITVTTEIDGLHDDGLCGLREAVIAANTNQAVYGCPAGSSTAVDRIIVITGTYVLTETGVNENAAYSGDLDIAGSLTLQGAGQNAVIIDGNATDRVFDISGNITVTITGLTIQNGYGQDGGGIYVGGASRLTVNNVRISSNVATSSGGGIWNKGFLTIINSVIDANVANTGDGGGVYQWKVGTEDPVIVISNTIITSNSATHNSQASGGGVYVDKGTIEFNNSSIVNNISKDSGGGIHMQGDNTFVSLTNTTVGGNFSDGVGGLHAEGNGASYVLNNVTIANNSSATSMSGGIYIFSQSNAIVKNSIIAHNLRDGGEADCGGIAITSHGYNLIGSNTCPFATQTGDLTNTNPRISTLTSAFDTYIYVLESDSPAIDAGNPSPPGSGGDTCSERDQRGEVRPLDGDADSEAHCDIGAVEFNSATDQLVINLQAVNDSPTTLSNFTVFTATVGQGASVDYRWDFGDGTTGIGAIISHTYGTIGNYTAVVTASNSINFLTTTTQVEINPAITDPDLTITKTGPTTAVAGTSIIYHITLSNTGDLPASNVIVTDTLPVSTTIVGSSHTYTLDSSNNTAAWQFPFLQSGTSESISLELQVDTNAPVSITNRVMGTITEIDPNLTNNQAEYTTTISPLPPGPDIAVSQTGPDSIAVGFPLEYNISVVNQGGQVATGVIVTDMLPANVTFISSTHESFNTTYYSSTGKVVFAIGAMPPGQTRHITLFTELSNTAPLGNITNHITATLNETDADSRNNHEWLTTTVVAAAPRLSIQPATSGSKHAILPILQDGVPVSMVITITNKGTATLVGGLSLDDIDTPWLNVFPLTFSDDIAVGASVTATLSVADTSQAIGNYYDRITVNSPNYEQLGFFLRLYVHPELASIVAPITNDLGDDIPKAQVLLEKPRDHVFVVDGIIKPDTYFSQLRVADSNGDAHFSQVEIGVYTYTVAAKGHETITGQVTVNPGQTQLSLPALRALPGLIFVPNQATLSVVAGEQSYFTLEVRNEGPGHATNFAIETPHDLPWISSGLPYSVTELLAGESMFVTLFMNPPSDMENSRYQRYITVTADDYVSNAILAATVNVLVTETGSLEFSIVDNYGLPVAGAYVIATNESGRPVTINGIEELIYDSQSGVTDANGNVTLPDLPQGEYAYHIDANGYYVENGSVEVSAGSAAAGENGNWVHVQLVNDPFSYSWTVSETTITDTYAYTVTITLDNPTEPTLFVSPITFCPSDDDTHSFIISNASAADIDNVMLTPDHTGISFSIGETMIGSSYSIGTIAAGEAFIAEVGTSASGTYDRYGQFIVSADYRTSAGSIPYQVSITTEAHCSESGGGEWAWIFDGNATIGTFTGSQIPSFPSDPPPAAPPNDRENITLVLSGDATIERQAFNARLQINSLAASNIDNITVDILATDSSGNVVSGFAITPTVPTLLGVLSPEATVVGEWLVVPGDLGITDANGAVYYLKAKIDYQMGGQSFTTETIPKQITVYPQPLVRLLFSTTQPDDNGDFQVEVIAQNDGYGIARNLTLDLSNVTVLGHLDGTHESLSFNLKETIIDGTLINRQYIFPFGNLAPGVVSIGHWKINVSAPNNSSLEDILITGFDVSCHHKPYQGLELSAIIDCSASTQAYIAQECPLVNGEGCEEVGGPINTANGNYTYRQGIPAIHAVGDPLQFEWTYNSLNTGISAELPILTSALGTGWTHNYQLFLDLSGIGSPERVVAMRAPHGTPLDFYVVRDGFRAAPGVLATLTRTQVFPDSYIYTVKTAVQTTYVFSETGRLLSQQDAQGNTRTFTYNAADQLEEVRDPVSGNTLVFTYLPNGMLESVSDPLNRSTQFGYDQLGMLTTITDTNHYVWQYDYTQLAGGQYLLSTITDPEGRIVEDTQFDEFGRAISQTFTGQQLQIDYFDDGRRLITDGLQHSEMHIYNTQDVLIAKYDAWSGIETYVLDSYQNRVDVEDKLGHTTTAVRTPLGYSPVITNPAGFATHYEFDAFNNMLSTTDANDHTTTYDYDPSHNLITETNALDQQTTHTYNEWGQLTSTTDARGSTTEYGYNTLGQKAVVTNSLGLTTTYEYDIVGRLITTTDTLGKVTLNVYDAADNLTRVTSNYLAGQPQNYLDKYNLVTEYGYDKSGYQTVVTNTVGQVDLTLRDAYGRVVTSVTNYDGVTPMSSLCTDFTDPDPEYNICSLTGYNAVGQVVTSTNSLGVSSVTEYDNLGRVVRAIRNWDDGVFDANEPDRDIQQLTQYDAVGNTIIVTDTMGNMTRHFYNELNQGVGSIRNWSGTITRIEDLPTCFSLPAERETDICALYAYDAIGNRIIVTDTVGHMTRTFYDELNRGWATVENWNPATLSSPADCVLVAGNHSDENICSLSGYDDQGRHITTTNALGQTSLTVYDAQNRPYLTVANWDGTSIQDVSDCHFPPLQPDTNLCSVSFYNDQGQRTSSQNAMGRITEYGYDDIGRVITTTQYLADGTRVRSITTYGLMGNRAATENAEGYVTRYAYDSLSRLQSTISPEGVVITNTYNAAGQIVGTINNLGHTTQKVYDDLGRLVMSVDGENNAIQYEYDALGNRVAVIDANDTQTTYLYDSLNRQVGQIANDTGGAQTVDSNVLTQYEYDVFGNLVSVINAEDAVVSSRQYDDLNRLIQETDALSHSAYYEYDALGNTVVITDANGAVTQYLYDGLNRVQSVQYLADGATVANTYDALGNVLAMTDAVGTTTAEYDNLGRPQTITDALGAAVIQTYDLLGNRTHVTYPTGEVVTSTYDGDNRLLTVEAWDGGLTRYEYDSVGHMVAMTLPNGVQSTALYDHADRLTQMTHTAPGDVLLGQYAYQLDGNGLAEVVTETLRSPVVAALNGPFLESSGLVVMGAEHGVATPGSSHTWQSQTTQAGYGGDGYQRALPDVGALYTTDDLADSPHLSFPMSFSTPATYTVWVRGMAPDAAGDSLHVGLDADTSSAQALTGFAPGEWSWANTTLSNTQAALNLSASSAYTLDLWLREDGLRVDRVLLITDTHTIPSGVGPAESVRNLTVSGGSLDTHTITYGYDDLYRLTSAQVSGDLTASYGYEYDVLGNRMAYTATLTNTVVTTYTYDIANRLKTAMADDTGVIWHYVYDNNGNRLQQLPGSLTPTEGAIQYTYDQRGQLVQVATHEGNSLQLQAEMVYDGVGNRLQAIAHAGGSTITATYTLDPRSGLPLAVDNGTNVTMILYGQTAVGEYAVQTAAWTYYLGDAQLSVRQLVDESGAVTQAKTYGPYGVLLHQAGDGGGLFGYKGGQSGTNGLWYFGDGYFDPNTGQFLATNGSPLLPLAAAAMANPAGLLLGPVLFINWRKRKGKKGMHPATFLLLGVLLAAGLSSCGGGGGATGIPGTPTLPPTGTSTPMPTTVTVTQVPMGTSTATVVSITAVPCPTPTPTPTPTRIVQVNLETHQKPYQYSPDILNEFGYNACGLVAATAPFVSPGEPAYIDTMKAIVENAPPDSYGSNKGIQPGNYVQGLDGVYGGGNVIAHPNWTIDEMFNALVSNQIVIVDMKVQKGTEIPSSTPDNYAHFARVLGIDKVKNGGEIYIENTLSSTGSYWTLNLTTFENEIWVHPETDVSIPAPDAEDVTKWAVTIASGATPSTLHTPTPAP